VGDEEVGVDFSVGDEVYGRLDTVVLSSDVEEGDFFSSGFGDVEGEAFFAGDADDEEFATGFEEVDGVVDGILLAGAFEGGVESERPAVEEFLDHVLRVGISDEGGAVLTGDLDAFVDFFGHEDGVIAKGLCGDHDTKAYGSGPEDGDGGVGVQVCLFGGVDADGEGFAEGGLVEGDAALGGVEAVLRHDEEFAEAAEQFTGAAEEFEISTGVFPAGAALIAGAAGDGGVDGDLIAGFDAIDALCGFDDGGGAFVADAEGECDDVFTDAAGFVVVDVTTADAGFVDFQEDVGVRTEDGGVHVLEFEFSDVGLKYGLHVCGPGYEVFCEPLKIQPLHSETSIVSPSLTVGVR